MNDETQLREVHMVEVMESVEEDRVIEHWGKESDAKQSARLWREKGRWVKHTVETIRWS